MADLWQAGLSETYTDGPCHSLVCFSLGNVSASVHRGWELEHGDWRANSGRGLLLDARRQPQGVESEEICNQECLWRCHC